MKTTTRDDIVQLIKKQGQVSPHQLKQQLGFGGPAIHRQLKSLERAGTIAKLGSPPKVVYVLRDDVGPATRKPVLSQEVAQVINDRYTYIQPDGTIMSGVDGFVRWVEKTGQRDQLPTLALDYVKIRKEADTWYQGRSWIDATQKLSQTFPDTQVDTVAYADFYALPKFGKTTLGTYTLHAKVSQSRALMVQIAQQIQPLIEQLLTEWKIQAVAFIPHSVPRKLAFLPIIQTQLGLSLPTVQIEKLYAGDIRVAQKSLSSLQDRVENARKTLFVTGEVPWQRIVLIDDAVGSGATFNEVAGKLKHQHSVKFIAGFAIVGSYKGFEVISEV